MPEQSVDIYGYNKQISCDCIIVGNKCDQFNTQRLDWVISSNVVMVPLDILQHAPK